MSKISIRAVPERFLNPSHREFKEGLSNYRKGGKYLDPNGEDLTGQYVYDATIAVASMSVSFTCRDPGLDRPLSPPPSPSARHVIRTNLFRQKAGWRWEDGSGQDVTTLVSIEYRGRHIYCLSARYDTVRLESYPDAASEPRLRPTTHGAVHVDGQAVGCINVRGRSHTVWEHVTIT